MIVSIYFTPSFSRKYKRYKKKFATIEADLKHFLSEIDETNAVSLGGGVFKYRFSVKSKNKGKSGGFRIITFEILISEEQKDITLLTLFDKSEQSSITKTDVTEILKKEGLL